jgi:hypothetical protein
LIASASFAIGLGDDADYLPIGLGEEFGEGCDGEVGGAEEDDFHGGGGVGVDFVGRTRIWGLPPQTPLILRGENAAPQTPPRGG